MSGLRGEAGFGGFEEDIDLRLRIFDEADLQSGVSELGILDGKEEALGFGGVASETGKSARGLRKRMKAKDGAGDDPKSTEGAGDKFGKIVAGDVFYDFTAAGGESAVGERDGDADDEIAEGAEAKTKRAGVVGGKDAADSGGFGPERVDGEALIVAGESGLEFPNRAAGFDGDGQVGPGVFEDFVEAGGGEDDVGARGRMAPGEFGAAAAWDDGEAGIVGEADDGGELEFVGRFEDELRLDAADGVGGNGGADVVGAKDRAEEVLCGVERGSHTLRWREYITPRREAKSNSEAVG